MNPMHDSRERSELHYHKPVMAWPGCFVVMGALFIVMRPQVEDRR